MKKFKAVSAALAATLLLTSCGGGNVSTGGGSGEKTEYTISDKPVELTMFFVNDPKLEDSEVWQEIAKLTNVSLKTVSPSSADASQALNTTIMSGDIPDLIIYGDAKSFANQYGPEGAFARIDELVDKYNCENLKKQLNRPEVHSYVIAPDEHIYYMCGVNPKTVAAGWFIRQDWLDKLGLESPKSVDDYYNVLCAFRDNDPNGNGKKDEVPYFSRFSSPYDLTALWGGFTDWNQQDGKVFYGPKMEEYKTSLKNIAKWYKEGLIDKEIFTRGGKSRDKLLGDNVGGSTHDWFGSTAQFNDILKDKVPGLQLKAFAPPTGKEYSIRDVAITQGAMIGANSKNLEAAIKLLDFSFSEKGSRFSNFGIEGKHYDMEGDYPKFQDWVVHGDKTAINILKESGACTAFPYLQDFRYEEQWMNDDANEGAQLYLNNNYLVEKFPALSYSKEDYDKFNKIMTDIKTYVQETSQQWVFGSKDVDATWDEYVATLDKFGLDEAMQIQQKAYDKYMEFAKNQE